MSSMTEESLVLTYPGMEEITLALGGGEEVGVEVWGEQCRGVEVQGAAPWLSEAVLGEEEGLRLVRHTQGPTTRPPRCRLRNEPLYNPAPPGRPAPSWPPWSRPGTPRYTPTATRSSSSPHPPSLTSTPGTYSTTSSTSPPPGWRSRGWRR